MLTKYKFLEIRSSVVSVLNGLIIVTYLSLSCLLQKLRKLNAILNTNLHGVILFKPRPHNGTTLKLAQLLREMSSSTPICVYHLFVNYLISFHHL